MFKLGAGHVWQMSLEPDMETAYVRIFLASWIGNGILSICTSSTHSMHPHDSTRLLGHKKNKISLILKDLLNFSFFLLLHRPYKL
jgi:hypothetical protein